MLYQRRNKIVGRIKIANQLILRWEVYHGLSGWSLQMNKGGRKFRVPQIFKDATKRRKMEVGAKIQGM
jgi:hypothetical protein